MSMDKFNKFMAIPQVILCCLVIVQLHQNQSIRSEILGQFEELQTKTDRAIYSLQSQIESKFNSLREMQDQNQINNERALRNLNERVKNLEQKPVVIFNGQNGYRTSGQNQINNQ
ncbi:hypothetical protein SB11R_00175 [Pseudomonas oryzihabitans]|nr:hypothetical protein SB11R_00175 [Pseudomonas psychrotolerans]